MRWIAVALLVVGASCADRYDRRNIDGVDCVVARRKIGTPTAISCDWTHAPTTRGAP